MVIIPPCASAQTYMQYVDSADNYVKRELWADAERNYLSALRLEPANSSNALIHSNLGRVRAELGRYDDAMQSYDIGLSMAPRSTMLLEGRAALLLSLRRDAEALADLDKALGINGDLINARLLRGSLRLRSGDTDAAEEDFRELLRVDSINADAMSALGNCAHAKGNVAEALRWKMMAIEQGDDPDLRFDRAAILLENSRLEEAAEEIRLGLKLDPRFGDLYLLRAYIHRLRYEKEDEEADKKLALENGVDPQLVRCYLP